MHSRDTEFGKYAYRLCKGREVEIGALHKPFDLDADALYLDRYSTKELIKAYAGGNRVSETRPAQLVSGEDYYPFIGDEAFDFIISSNVLEHTTNPERAIEEWLRIIKPKGVVYMVFPDKRFCFDRKRETTKLDHLMEEFQDKINVTSLEHYEDLIYNTEGEDGISRSPKKEFVERCWKEQSSIHVHTFTSESAVELIEALAAYLSFEVELYAN